MKWKDNVDIDALIPQFNSTIRFADWRCPDTGGVCKNSRERLDRQVGCWGVSSCIDLYGCDLSLMQDEAAIKHVCR